MGDSLLPTLPRYGSASLAEVMPAIAAATGVPGFTDVLGLPPARRAVLLLIDGLGSHALAAQGEVAPTLSRLAALHLTAGFPSTTAVSLTSLATGLPPGRHGILGYRMWTGHGDVVLHSLRWQAGVDPREWQRNPTVFERVADAGKATAYVGASTFAASGLTRAAWRGAVYIGADTPGDLVATTAQAVWDRPDGLVYSYYPELDRTGHIRGPESAAWRLQLQLVDLMVAQLIELLPPSTLVLVTGDHGMVDVAAADRINMDTALPDFDPEALGAQSPPPSVDVAKALVDGVTVISGEDRTRYLHTVAGAAEDVAAAWRDTYGDRAWVATRQQAIDDGWFGSGFNAEFSTRIGDVIIAAGPAFAAHASVREPRHGTMPLGLHGSLTEMEQRIPLLYTVT